MDQRESERDGRSSITSATDSIIERRAVFNFFVAADDALGPSAAEARAIVNRMMTAENAM